MQGKYSFLKFFVPFFSFFVQNARSSSTFLIRKEKRFFPSNCKSSDLLNFNRPQFYFSCVFKCEIIATLDEIHQHVVYCIRLYVVNRSWTATAQSDMPSNTHNKYRIKVSINACNGQNCASFLSLCHISSTHINPKCRKALAKQTHTNQPQQQQQQLQRQRQSKTCENVNKQISRVSKSA